MKASLATLLVTRFVYPLTRHSFALNVFILDRIHHLGGGPSRVFLSLFAAGDDGIEIPDRTLVLRYRTGWNLGMAISSVQSSNVTATSIPIVTRSGAQPTMFVIIVGPSPRVTRATT